LTGYSIADKTLMQIGTLLKTIASCIIVTIESIKDDPH
jgi:hypothetical protein